MDSTFTPIIYQLMYLGNEGENNLKVISTLNQYDKQLKELFAQFESNIPDIPDNLIDRIILEANNS